MDRKPKTFDAMPVQAEVISPKTYLGLSKKAKANIAETTIVAPRLGQNGFGGVLIRYKSPVYKAG